jgi:hypothetical protein
MKEHDAIRLDPCRVQSQRLICEAADRKDAMKRANWGSRDVVFDELVAWKACTSE